MRDGIGATVRAVAASVCVFGAMLVSGVASHASAVNPITIYSDSLGPGWSDWSWSTDVNWQDTNDPHSGSDDVAFTFTSGWDGLSMHSDASIDTSTYDMVQFWVNGGSAGGQQVWLYVDYTAGGSSSPGVNINPYIDGGSIAANTWRLVQVPLSAVGGSQTAINRIDFFNNSGAGQPQLRLDDISIMSDGKAPPPPGHQAVTVTVNASSGHHSISPYIYGVAFGGQAYLKQNNLTVDRWGGDSVSRYNWRLGSATNLASDWFFENADEGTHCTQPGCAVDNTIQGDRAGGAASLITVPTIGWVAKNSSLDTCGFAVSTYGAQQATDPYRPNCGNGKKPDGQDITGNDPTDTSVKSTPSDIEAWIKHLVAKWGTAAKGGVKFYAMDNEPELWNSTHRDVRPDPLTYDGLYHEFEDYASVVRKVDPTAMIDGPIPWGWSAYFDSSWDYANNTTSDQKAHGGLPIIPWFLKTVRAHDVGAKVRTLNVLDIHYYPQEDNVFSSNNSPTTDALRLRATRSLWDPTYTDESWIGTAVDLIPRMQKWINEYYAGTKLGISEWNFGNEESMNGALAIANALGVYGRENVYLANYWTHPAKGTPGTLAFDMFRNYDGKNDTFGNQSVSTSSNQSSDLMAFGATRSSDHALTVMLVNQLPTTDDNVTLNLKNVHVAGKAAVYRLGPSASGIQHLASVATSSSMSVKVPAYSIELLVIPTS